MKYVNKYLHREINNIKVLQLCKYLYNLVSPKIKKKIIKIKSKIKIKDNGKNFRIFISQNQHSVYIYVQYY